MSPQEPPGRRVSVVMPILDEESHLEDAVAMVLRQDWDGDLEVVLALGPSSDRTDEVAERLAREDARVRLVANPSGRTPDALNAAVAASRGEVVVRVDGHAGIPEDYVSTAVRVLEETGADTVGGVMDARGVTRFQRAVAAAMRSPLGVGASRFHTGGDAGPVDTVYLGVFRRSALERVGGYDRRFTRTQDWELNHRIRASGGVVWFTPELLVTYRPRSGMRALARQYRDYGRWRRVVAGLHDGTVSLRYLAAPTMVLGTSAATLVGVVWAPALAVPAAYVLAVTVGGVLITPGEEWRVRALAGPVVATMHWSWGWGFLTSRPRRLLGDVPPQDPAATGG